MESLCLPKINTKMSNRTKSVEMSKIVSNWEIHLHHPFFYKQSIFDPHLKNCLSFRHLQGHLKYVMHTFELRSPKLSISLRFPMQKKGF